LDAVKAHATSLAKDKEKLQRNVAELQKEVLELKEQVQHVYCKFVDFITSTLLKQSLPTGDIGNNMY